MQLSGMEGALAERLMAHLTARGRRGATAEALARQAPAGTADDEIAAALALLLAAGRAADWQGRWYAVAATDWVAGVVERRDDGGALVKRLGEREPAFAVARGRLRGALDGDRVLVKRLPVRDRPRSGEEGGLPGAAVVRLLAPGYPTVVGTLDADEEDRRWLVPFDLKTPLEIEVLDGERVPAGHFVEVEVLHGSGERAHPRGRVAAILGSPDTPGVDVEVVLRHHGIPDRFPPEVLAAAAALPPDPVPADWAGREDLRDVVTVTIDGESARDFDDALSLERLDRDVVRLGVHIADVSHYVAGGGVLDREAYRRGTSVYYPDRAVPMLPERLSNGLCSLRPGVPRLALSAFLDLGRDGEVRGRRFARTVIRSHRRLTYAEVRRVLEEGKPRDPLDYGPVLPLLREMQRVMETLLRRRGARGSIDFDLPEGDVELGTDGHTVGILPQERNVAHRIVEEFMIAANEAVAEALETAGLSALYRVHDPPDATALTELAALLAPLGVRLGGDFATLPPGALQAVLAQVAGGPHEEFVSTVVLRTMQRAVYSPECRGHYALASRFYTHFTSPIRRYPDLLIHRQLKALVAGDAGEATLAERLPAIADHAGATERRAEQSERDLLQWKKVRFLAHRVGESFRGRITAVQPFGLFVQLADLYVDGLVPIRTLGDDFYRFEGESRRLVGERHGRVFQLADEVDVVLTGVSERHRGLDLKVADLREPKGRSRGPKGRAGRRRPQRSRES